MFMMKISVVLAVFILSVCHLYSSHAVPIRPALDSLSDRLVLSDYEARRLLNAIVKEFVHMTLESDQRIDNNSKSRVLVKRCSSLSTCVLGKLSQELHKLQTFPRTDVGAGTPGKKRSATYGEKLDTA
ncbi:calcitonin-like isoform X1 [Tachysurus fulvidraco]|uniref:calcitonin-like isoform X1 n=1 Tax=Tachysurus fulvidraco TaxID=1234273 RepID=UPI001FF02FD5|nr:calcitonin-like isoform X1 [Tachysurus fulvidraco]XP_027016672.2 calcitonin-like isoform X1 [Tachysurus fulvidraco]